MGMCLLSSLPFKPLKIMFNLIYVGGNNPFPLTQGANVSVEGPYINGPSGRPTMIPTKPQRVREYELDELVSERAWVQVPCKQV